MQRWWIVLLVLLAPLSQAASPSVHAFLDRNHVSVGDTVTLNIRSDGQIGMPDLSPLQQDFQVLGTSRSRSVQVVKGNATHTSQLGIALRPLHAGTLTIPALSVGGVMTQPLTVTVAAAPSGGKGTVGDPVFMQADVQSSSPYVGQQTVYTVRLFYLPGVDGALGDPSADGARLIKLDRDHRYTVDRNGYAYQVIERSWALIPQRSGTLTVQGPVFQGQQLGPGTLFNNPNAIFNNPNALLNGQIPGFGAAVHASAPDVKINARATPANAGKPWLPARDVQLKLTGLPPNGEVNAGEPLTITLTISASGQPADALPEPALPAIPGAEVYPDQTQDATDDSGEWLQGTRTRSFAIVPQRNGTLTIPAITLDWWNVESGHDEQAKLPAHALRVSGVAANASSAPTPAASSAGNHAAAVTESSVSMPATRGTATFWKVVALASLVLWLLVVVALGMWWWLRRGSRMQVSSATSNRGTDVDRTADGGNVESRATPASAGNTVSANTDLRVLQRRAMEAARSGDAVACEHALLQWARASRAWITNTGALREALSDPAQQEALDALQRVRWQGGDAAPACAAVADAFKRDFLWRGSDEHTQAGDGSLPPLYPS